MQDILKNPRIEASMFKLIIVSLDMCNQDELDSKMNQLKEKVKLIIPEVNSVLYPWFDSLPNQALAKTQLKGQTYYIGSEELQRLEDFDSFFLKYKQINEQRVIQ